MSRQQTVPMVDIPGPPPDEARTEVQPAAPEAEARELPVERALISVWEKEGIEEFARELVAHGAEVIATEGTYEQLVEAGIPVTHIEQVTGVSEALDGRVKTLDRTIHIGVQADRSQPGHMRQLEELGMQPIDLVCINFKPFEEAAFSESPEVAIERIDIGGHALLRAAAKNHDSVVIVSTPFQYKKIKEELREKGGIGATTRRDCAGAAFDYASRYDERIAAWLKGEA